MPHQQIPIAQFKGLALADQASLTDPGAMIDCLDAELTTQGRLKMRRSFGEILAAQTTTKRTAWQAHYGPTNNRLLAWNETVGRGECRTQAGVAVTNSVSVGAGAAHSRFVRSSSGGVEYVYVATLGGLLRFNPSSEVWSSNAETVTAVRSTDLVTASGAVGPLGTALGMWGSQNRMAIGGFVAGNFGPGSVATPATGQAVGTDYVWFSEPNDAQRFSDTAFVRLGTGDGDTIQAIVAWRDLLFVFKKRRFWVFTSTTVDFQGVVTYNYRVIDVGVGAVGPAAVCVGDDGVYFVSDRGLHRTRGADPELLSDAVDPLWTGLVPPNFSGQYICPTRINAVSCTYVRGRVYIGYTGHMDDGMGVGPLWIALYDTLGQWWGLWSGGGAQAAVDRAAARTMPLEVFEVRFGDQPEIVMSLRGGLARELGAWVTGNIDRPVGYAQLAWSDGGSGRVRRLFGFEVAGRGAVEAGFAADFAAPAPSGVANVALTSTLLASRQLVRRAVRARSFSFWAKGVDSGAQNSDWAVDEVIAHMGGVKPAENVDAVNAA